MKKAKPAKRKPKPRNIEPAWEVVGDVKPAQESCGNCHFHRDETCKRYPPEKREGHVLASHRTRVPADEWCGEWRHASS